MVPSAHCLFHGPSAPVIVFVPWSLSSCPINPCSSQLLSYYSMLPAPLLSHYSMLSSCHTNPCSFHTTSCSPQLLSYTTQCSTQLLSHHSMLPQLLPHYSMSPSAPVTLFHVLMNSCQSHYSLLTSAPCTRSLSTSIPQLHSFNFLLLFSLLLFCVFLYPEPLLSSPCFCCSCPHILLYSQLPPHSSMLSSEH
jgi:hypothetical protein